jgi:hypothetical protein
MLTTDGGIGSPLVVMIRGIVGISDGGIVPSIRTVVHQAKTKGRSCEISMERGIGIITVVHVDITGMVIIKSPVVVIDIHAAKSEHPSTVIADVHIANLCHTPIKIIKNRDILYLDHSTVVIVLCIRTIIVTGIEGNRNPIVVSDVVIYIKIELPIRKYGKRNAVLHKNKGVVVSISIADCNLIFFNTCGHDTGGTYKKRRKEEY